MNFREALCATLLAALATASLPSPAQSAPLGSAWLAGAPAGERSAADGHPDPDASRPSADLIVIARGGVKAATATEFVMTQSRGTGSLDFGVGALTLALDRTPFSGWRGLQPGTDTRLTPWTGSPPSDPADKGPGDNLFGPAPVDEVPTLAVPLPSPAGLLAAGAALLAGLAAVGRRLRRRP